MILIMQIVLCIVSYSIMKYRTLAINTDYQAYYNKFSTFELSIRKWLKSGELHDELITQMNKNFNLYQDKLNIVIQTYYCSDALLNNSLAYNKIIGIKYEGLNIFTNFQVYKCKKMIVSNCNASEIEGIQLYQYFSDLEKLKIDDFNLCKKYLKFSQGIIEPNPNISKLKTHISKLFDHKSSLICKYESILSKFPNSEEVNDMYGSFLVNIICDIKKGQAYLNKSIESANSIHTLNGKFAKINNRGFVILSGKIKNLGKLIYANKNFFKFLGIPSELIDTYFFSNFLPKSYSKDHNLLLKHFLSNYTESIVYQNLPLFLIDYEGYLREFYISLECIGDKDSIKFVCNIDPIYCGKRELAVIDLNGIIYSHSKNFITMLGYNYKNAENMNIQYFLQEIIINELEIDLIYEIKQRLAGIIEEKSSKVIGIVLKRCEINEIIVHALFVTDDINQLNSWKTRKNFYSIEGFDYKSLVVAVNDEGAEKINREKDKEKKKENTEENEDKVQMKLLQFPEESLNKMSKETSFLSIADKCSNSEILDRTELKAEEKSRRVLNVTRTLLFVSVIYI